MGKKRTSSGGAQQRSASGGATQRPSSIQQEKEAELSAIWGERLSANATNDLRAPARKKQRGRRPAEDDDDDLGSDAGSVISNLSVDSARQHDTKDGAAKTADKKKKSKKNDHTFRLHCFIEPGTTKNDVRDVFEQYEPKVALKVTQKGNVLNKSHFCVLTFSNKAMGLHAVKMLDGTNQRDSMGVNPLKLSIMLTRAQHKWLARKKKPQTRRR